MTYTVQACQTCVKTRPIGNRALVDTMVAIRINTGAPCESPAINPLIKIINIVALLIIPLIVK